MRKKIYLLIQHQKFLCICCLWLYNNAYHIMDSFSFPVLQTMVKIVFCNGERIECSFTFPLPGTEIMMQPLPGTTPYSLTDTLKPGSTLWSISSVGWWTNMSRSCIQLFYWSIKSILFSVLGISLVLTSSAFSYFCDSLECVCTLLDFEKSVLVFSALGITYSFTYRGVNETNDM